MTFVPSATVPLPRRHDKHDIRSMTVAFPPSRRHGLPWSVVRRAMALRQSRRWQRTAPRPTTTHHHPPAIRSRTWRRWRGVVQPIAAIAPRGGRTDAVIRLPGSRCRAFQRSRRYVGSAIGAGSRWRAGFSAICGTPARRHPDRRTTPDKPESTPLPVEIVGRSVG